MSMGSEDTNIIIVVVLDQMSTEVDGSMRVVNATFLKEYSQQTSVEFLRLQSNFCETVSSLVHT